MKKYLLGLLPFLLLALSINPTQAQTQKGNIMVGMQVANIGGTFQNGSNSFALSLTPSAAYFVKNNLALGGMIDLGLQSENSSTSFSYGIGPWARYYFEGPKKMRFSPHASFFLDGFVGFQGISHQHGGSTNGIGIKVGPGLSYFLTSNISLDAAINYNLVLGFGNATTVNKLGLNIGFQIFLPGHDLKEKYQNGHF